MKWITGALLLALMVSCSNTGSGELIGTANRKRYIEPQPHGMRLVPGGTTLIGSDEEDALMWDPNTTTKSITVNPFYMDETEITNAEYRQFVQWVKDSIIRRELLMAGYDEFMLSMDDERSAETAALDWNMRIDTRNEDIIDLIRQEMYLPEEEWLFGKPALRTEKLVFTYEELDLKRAATGDYGSRRDLIKRTSVAIYPDTLCWMKDFDYMYNEPITSTYFWHEAYDNYPVVGITWEQATAFCAWRTKRMNDALNRAGMREVFAYRLPSEYEWEFAARANLTGEKYPWGSEFTRNEKDCFLANFKPSRGNYSDDGWVQTAQVAQYAPNDFGLYDMAGNVAEWTWSAYDESAYEIVSDVNPDFRYEAKADDPSKLKRKVIRGGSWKDIEYYVRVSTRSYEYQDSARSYIGFRCVRDYLGSPRR